MSSPVYFILCLLGGGEKSVVGLYGGSDEVE